MYAVEPLSPAMNRARSSFDQKPPLAVSPRRLRPRRGRPEAAAPRTPPAPSPKEAPLLRRSCAVEESRLTTEYEKISRELKALAKSAQDDFASAEALQATAFATHVAGGNSSLLFERGRLYDVYSARRNERLKRKMEETADEEAPARHNSAADAEVAGKRRSTRRMDSVRKSAPEYFPVVDRTPSMRSSLRSSTKESKTSSVLIRSAVEYNAEEGRRAPAQAGRKK